MLRVSGEIRPFSVPSRCAPPACDMSWQSLQTLAIGLPCDTPAVSASRPCPFTLYPYAALSYGKP